MNPQDIDNYKRNLLSQFFIKEEIVKFLLIILKTKI